MGKYTYNAGLVTQALAELNDAEKSLNSTNTDMQKGINTIETARGAVNISIDYTPILGYQSQVLEYIELMDTEIRTKAQEIEEYENAPWYTKLFATIGLGALKIVEGLGSFVENIGDGLISITGFIGGIFSSDFRDACGEIVKKDYVGEAFYNAYETGWLQDINQYSVMSHTSTAANILKGAGNALGYVALSLVPGGLAVTTTAAGIGGIGSGTQSGLQAGMTFNQAFGQGVKQGAIAAGTTLLLGKAGEALGKASGGALYAADDIANSGKIIGAAKTFANRLATSSAGQLLGKGAAALGTTGVTAVSTAIGVSAAGTPQAAFNGAGIIDATKDYEASENVQQVLYGPPTPNLVEEVFIDDTTNTDPIPKTPEDTPTQDTPTQDPEVSYGVGTSEVPQVLYGPPPADDSQPIQGPVKVENSEVPQVLYGPPTVPDTPVTQPAPEQAVSADVPQVLYGPPTVDPVQPTKQPDISSEDVGLPITSSTQDPTTTQAVTSSSTVHTDSSKLTGSLSSMIGTKTSIPKTSTPITTTSEPIKYSSAAIPAAAGLGAAGLAGWGAKVYLDKHESKSEEDEDEIKTDEWDEESSLIIDDSEKTENNEEKDYLSPEDEYAFQE